MNGPLVMFLAIDANNFFFIFNRNMKPKTIFLNLCVTVCRDIL